MAEDERTRSRYLNMFSKKTIKKILLTAKNQ